MDKLTDAELRALLLEVFYLVDYHGGKVCVDGDEYGPVHFAHALDVPLERFAAGLLGAEKPWVPRELVGG